MLFNSYIFIFAFYPITLLLYFLGARYNKKISMIILICMSLVFYGYFNPWYLLVILSSIILNFIISKLIYKRKSKALLLLGIAFNVAIIFYFKYFNFFKSFLNSAFRQDFVITEIVLPLGISFFTFQQISFLVDSYKGETADYNFLEYALFVSFFPQLIAGPIVLHRELIPQFRDESKRHPNADNMYSGLVLFIYGLAKKVLLADTFAKCVNLAWNSGVESLTALEIFLVMLSYTFQIYFDFSAYSDMATGIARTFNIALPMNFNSPYKAVSIIDFWKRWHMTLTRFLREYIYIPLGGNRKGNVRTYLNIFIVFLISGIWHGANWTFYLWGILHGLANMLTRALGRFYNRMHVAFQWLVTFSVVNVLWLLFRADSVRQWIQLVFRMIKMENLSVRKELIDCFSLPGRAFVFDILHLNGLYAKMPHICALMFLVAGLSICLNHKNNIEKEIKAGIVTSLAAALLLFLSIISLGGVTVFIYFNF